MISVVLIISQLTKEPSVLQYDFKKSIGYWTNITSQAFQRALNEEVRPLGITWRQCQVLALLAIESRLSQAELAERMGIEPPTLVGILDRMERDGWIQRESFPGDRRKKIVVATEEAAPIWDAIATCARRVRQRATRGLTAEQVDTLVQMLDLVQQNLNTPADDPGSAAEDAADVKNASVVEEVH